MREKSIEQNLRKETLKRSGLCLKFTPLAAAGMPDRIILLPSGKVGFVEVKAKGQKPRGLQLRRHDQIRTLGFKVFILDDPDDIGGMLDAIQRT